MAIFKGIHISDLHIKEDENDNLKVRLLLETIHSSFPEHELIITGDITDDGEAKQYENAVKYLEPFVGRLDLNPGNHDGGWKGNLFSLKRLRRFDSFLGPLHKGGFFAGDNIPIYKVINGVRIISLDTNLETINPFDFACGEVGATQLKFLDEMLTRSKEVNLLSFHHHPFVRNDPFMELKDAKELAQVIFGRVHVLMFGHRHVQEHWEGRWDIPHILAAGKVSEETTVAEITIDNDGISIDYVEV